MGLYRFVVVFCEYFFGGVGIVWVLFVLVCVWVSFVDDVEVGVFVDRKCWLFVIGYGVDGCVNSN